jgi:hypothetical protein
MMYLFLFLVRLAYGLASNFWNVDEIQIYWIGLEFYSLGTWPYFGPDVVYSNSQIPGALMALLAGGPLFLIPVAESPIIGINLLSLGALVAWGLYIHKRLPQTPKTWLVAYLATLPWALGFSTYVTNPSYVLPVSIVFFLGWMEAMPSTSLGCLRRPLCFWMMGFALVALAQLHLSWIVLLPWTIWALGASSKNRIRSAGWLGIGSLTSGLFLIPTLWKYGWTGGSGGILKNLIFNWENANRPLEILFKGLLMGTYEIPYFMGSNTQERMGFLKEFLWASPATLLVTGAGWVHGLSMGFLLFKSKSRFSDWNVVRRMMLAMLLVLYIAFLFSTKNPASHTLYLVFPVASLYGVWVLREMGLLESKKRLRVLALLMGFNGIVFTALGIQHLKSNSLYLNRDKVQQAIDHKDPALMGVKRRIPNSP